MTGFGTVYVCRRLSPTSGDATPDVDVERAVVAEVGGELSGLHVERHQVALGGREVQARADVPLPGQYARPRRECDAADLYCQITFPVSGSSAVTVT